MSENEWLALTFGCFDDSSDNWIRSRRRVGRVEILTWWIKPREVVDDVPKVLCILNIFRSMTFQLLWPWYVTSNGKSELKSYHPTMTELKAGQCLVTNDKRKKCRSCKVSTYHLKINGLIYCIIFVIRYRWPLHFPDLTLKLYVFLYELSPLRWEKWYPFWSQESWKGERIWI